MAVPFRYGPVFGYQYGDRGWQWIELRGHTVQGVPAVVGLRLRLHEAVEGVLSRRHLTPPSSGHVPASRAMPLMSNVGPLVGKARCLRSRAPALVCDALLGVAAVRWHAQSCNSRSQSRPSSVKTPRFLTLTVGAEVGGRRRSVRTPKVVGL